jgi:hypothetical protein
MAAETGATGPAMPRRDTASGSSASSNPGGTTESSSAGDSGSAASPAFASTSRRATSRSVNASITAAACAERDRDKGQASERKPNSRCLH